MDLHYLLLLLHLIPLISATSSVSQRRNTATKHISQRGALANPGYDIRWPRNNGVAYIPYCFHDRATRRAIRTIVTAAVNNWHRRVGAYIHFYETVTRDNQPIYCERAGAPGNGWNPDLGSYDVVAFIEDDHVSSYTGYNPANRDPWQYIVGYDLAYFDVRACTHELGHVVGMTHEFQRPDRDLYLSINYANIEGVSAAVNRYVNDQIADYENQGYPRMSRDQLHAFRASHSQWWFSSRTLQAQYGSDFAADWAVEPVTHATAFDVDSIMMYYSAAHAQDRTRCTARDLRSCTMTAYVDPNNRARGTRYIPVPEQLSDGDVRWVRVAYG